MKTKYEIISVNDVEVTVDVSLLSKTEEMFFNATEIASSFGKMPEDFLRLKSTKEYVSEVLKDVAFNYGNSRNKNYDDLVKVKQGKYGGTWLHNELAFEFAGWCSTLFRRNLHKWVADRLQREQDWKRSRLESKTGYLKLSEAVQQAHDPDKGYHYSNEANMINSIVLGMDAKQFKAFHEVDDVRDALDVSQLRDIEKLQRINTGLIELGMDYPERKDRLTECHNRQLIGD